MLFANSQVVGTFKGFNDRGLEFAAEIVAPYDAGMLDRPQLGQFLLIELGSQEEASLGRITRFVPSGLLSSAEGEDYVNTMQRRQQAVPEDLKQQRLKYRVQVKLLGAVKVISNKIIYVPSQRRLPHLGAKVALPSQDVLKELCRLSQGETDLGDFVLGEFVYCGAAVPQKDPALRSLDPKLTVTFDIKNLVARRSVVFARAGYGKSNLMKFLIGELYRTQPKTDTNLDVGTLIFDTNGEYFWPDHRGRPGLCDVPHLRDKIVVFTNKPAPNAYYGSWKADSVRLDIRQLRARDVIGIAISAERQTQQNVLKLKSVSDRNWRDLVDLIFQKELQATDTEVGTLLGYQGATQIQNAAAEIAAARSNMFGVVRMLHDPNSRLLGGTLEALRMGSIVILDTSLLSSAAGNMLAGLLLRRIFSHNQENFTGGAPIIPVVTLIEEAQSVLGRNLDETSPFVEWVKEGRKYDLGAILITQQPGSMAPELLSQADNWFCFHLLSMGDAETLGKYNSHFSDDVLAHLIAEPIRGNAYMWSAPHQPFVLPVRIRDFEELYKRNVKNGAQESAITGTRGQAIREIVSNSHDQLKSKLIEGLKKPVVKFFNVANPSGGDALIAIGSSQLYYLIKEIKTVADTQSEEELKKPLMTLIFGEGAVSVVKQGDKEFFAAALADWTRVLGKAPRVSSGGQGSN